MSRRLPTYLLVDTSGSMKGEPIEGVNTGLRAMLAALRANPYALDSVCLAITTFDSAVKDVLPLTAVTDVHLPEIVCPLSGGTMLGAALEHVCGLVARDVRKASRAEKGDWRPILVILTDGKPTDTLAYVEVIERVQSMEFAKVIACAAGPKADSSALRRLTDHVVSLDTMDASGFAAFFEWVSETFAADSRSRGASAEVALPPPPAELNVVL